MSSPGSAVRVATRFCGAVLTVSGALLLFDAGATLAWQEPVTAIVATRAQSDLEGQLDAQRAAVGRGRTRGVADPGRLLAALAAASATQARAGRAFGRIELPTLDRSYAAVQGVEEGDLERGPGHYPSTPFPGQGGTVAIAGHRTTYLAPFRTIDRLRRDDEIIVTMPYGRFVYAVTGTRIVSPQTLSVIRRVGYERLVLTACHPVYSASQRIVVFARLRSATPVPAAGPRRSAPTRSRARTATG